MPFFSSWCTPELRFAITQQQKSALMGPLPQVLATLVVLAEESLTQASIEALSQTFSGKSQEAHQARSCDILHRIKSAKFNWVAKQYAPTHGLIPVYMCSLDLR